MMEDKRLTNKITFGDCYELIKELPVLWWTSRI